MEHNNGKEGSRDIEGIDSKSNSPAPASVLSSSGNPRVQIVAPAFGTSASSMATRNTMETRAQKRRISAAGHDANSSFNSSKGIKTLKNEPFWRERYNFAHTFA